MVRFLLSGRVQGPRADRETSSRRNKVAADYYRTAAASRWADYWLAALTGAHGGGNGGQDKQRSSFDRLDATVTPSPVLAPAPPVRVRRHTHTHTEFCVDDSNYFLVLFTIWRVCVKTACTAALRTNPSALPDKFLESSASDPGYYLCNNTSAQTLRLTLPVLL